MPMNFILSQEARQRQSHTNFNRTESEHLNLHNRIEKYNIKKQKKNHRRQKCYFFSINNFFPIVLNSI